MSDSRLMSAGFHLPTKVGRPIQTVRRTIKWLDSSFLGNINLKLANGVSAVNNNSSSGETAWTATFRLASEISETEAHPAPVALPIGSPIPARLNFLVQRREKMSGRKTRKELIPPFRRSSKQPPTVPKTPILGRFEGGKIALFDLARRGDRRLGTGGR